MNRIFRLRLGVASILVALACAPLLQPQRQLFHQYGSSDGLSNLNVRCLLQDRTGYIWVGTDNGLFRYDGGKFLGFGHADGPQQSIFRGRVGRGFKLRGVAARKWGATRT